MNPDSSPAPRDGVPPDLLSELHDANQRLSHAREHLEEAFDADVNGLAAREQAIREITDAEKSLEQVDEKIKGELEG